METPTFNTLRLEASAGVARIIFNNPPMNLLNEAMFVDLDRLATWLEVQVSIGVAVFESADPDFFIAHADLTMLENMPLPDPDGIFGPSPHQQVFERFRQLPQLTIGKLRGVARGGGSEFLLALDLRYAAIEHSILGQPEVALGFPPGCGATQRLPRLIGRSAAIEAIICGRDYSAVEAAQVGWINRALPDVELDAFVDKLARDVASRSPYAIAQSKQAIERASAPFADGLTAEFRAFLRAFASEQSKARVQQALASGFQTRALETGSLDGWCLNLSDHIQKRIVP
jgi:enoyl-CoA hydratase/carnithine racemase